MDEIASHISKYNRELVSIDMWKSHSLSSVGLQALSVCSHLEEVDFGWWYVLLVVIKYSLFFNQIFSQ